MRCLYKPLYCVTYHTARYNKALTFTMKWEGKVLEWTVWWLHNNRNVGDATELCTSCQIPKKPRTRLTHRTCSSTQHFSAHSLSWTFPVQGLTFASLLPASHSYTNLPFYPRVLLILGFSLDSLAPSPFLFLFSSSLAPHLSCGLVSLDPARCLWLNSPTQLR